MGCLLGENGKRKSKKSKNHEGAPELRLNRKLRDTLGDWGSGDRVNVKASGGSRVVYLAAPISILILLLSKTNLEVE